MRIPTNTGAVLRRTIHKDRELFYQLDAKGYWRYWDFSNRYLDLTAEEMQRKVDETEDRHQWTVEYWGYIEPVSEPEGIGAVVEVTAESGVVSRFVRVGFAGNDDYVDDERWTNANGDDTWFDWTALIEKGELKVLSEGVM